MEATSFHERDPFGHFAFEFDRLDKDHNGWLSPDELHHGLLSAGWEQDEVCGLFDVIDVDGNGKITREEFVAFRCAAEPSMKPMALDPKSIFGRMDENNDGGLDIHEFTKLIKELNAREGFVPDNQLAGFVKAQLAAADTNGDNKIDLEEFLPWYDNFIRFVEEQRTRRAKKNGIFATSTEKRVRPDHILLTGECWECELSRISDALEAAWAKKKTPLLIDHTDHQRDPNLESPLETLLSYGDYEFWDMRRFVIEVDMHKTKSLEQAREEGRRKLINSLKHGRVFTILLANVCPPITSRISSPDTLPLAIFDAAQAGAVSRLMHWDNLWPAQVIRPEDRCQSIGEFRVMVVTKFRAEDVTDFLGRELPLHLMQPIQVLLPADTNLP